MLSIVQRTVRAGGSLVWPLRSRATTAGPLDAGPGNAAEFKVPVEYYKLPNGLRVVLSPEPHRADHLRGGLLPHRISHRAARPHRVRAPVRTHDVSGLAESGKDGIRQAGAAERRQS